MRLCLHGNNRLYLGISWRPEPTGAAGFGPEYPPEACLACADRASVRGSSRDDGDHGFRTQASLTPVRRVDLPIFGESPSSVSSHLKDPQGTGTMRLCLHGNNRLYLGISWRPEPTGAAGFGPEYPPEACLACADRASVRGSSRDDGDHASSRQEQADGVALAGTLPRGRGRRTVAGSGPGVRQAPLGRRGEIAGVDEDDAGGTAERDPVECSHDGQGRRNQPVYRGSGPSMD